MFGASYIGLTQMQAAVAAPPHLAAIFPTLTASDYHDGWTYQGGAYEQWFNQSWGAILVQDTVDRLVRARTMTIRDEHQLPLVEYPLIDLGLPSSFGPAAVAPYYKDWLEHPSYDDYWKAFSVEENYQKIRVPAYHVGGVYDIFLKGTLRNYSGLKKLAATEIARNNQRLEIYMGDHNTEGPKVGALDFGPTATFNELDTMLRWYDYILKGEQNGLQNEKPVKIFVMGTNTWRNEDDWPPGGAHEIRYYLHSAGKANTLTGDGTLSLTASGKVAKVAFVYDPRDPVPTRGGALCCDEKKLSGGPFDQRAAENRPDVLVYTSDVVSREMDFIGPAHVEVFASSSAVDTDFTAKLIDVWPNGFAQNLTDGIIRAKYRDSANKPELMNPGQIYKFAIDLVATSAAILPGHRLRVEISSSNSPRFDRNLNTGESSIYATRMVTARNEIYHDASHPSAVVLTLAPTVAH
jgi:putative CocE/NonD family hydrolase